MSRYHMMCYRLLLFIVHRCPIRLESFEEHLSAHFPRLVFVLPPADLNLHDLPQKVTLGSLILLPRCLSLPRAALVELQGPHTDTMVPH